MNHIQCSFFIVAGALHIADSDRRPRGLDRGQDFAMMLDFPYSGAFGFVVYTACAIGHSVRKLHRPEVGQGMGLANSSSSVVDDPPCACPAERVGGVDYLGHGVVLGDVLHQDESARI